MSFAGSAASPAQFPGDGLPEIAFLGRSNVGKSSLLNALTGIRGLAKVSSTPGRTRVVNFFRLDHELYLADLPGYGYAKVPEAVRLGWEKLVRSYLEGRDRLALCVFLVDARHDPQPGDEVLRDYLDDLGLEYVVVATKSDKLGRGERQRRRRTLETGLARGARQVLEVSARTGDGLSGLWKHIRAVAARHREG